MLPDKRPLDLVEGPSVLGLLDVLVLDRLLIKFVDVQAVNIRSVAISNHLGSQLRDIQLVIVAVHPGQLQLGMIFAVVFVSGVEVLELDGASALIVALYLADKVLTAAFFHQ